MTGGAGSRRVHSSKLPVSRPAKLRELVQVVDEAADRGVEPNLSPRNAGSWPGYIFTGDPLKLPAGHFGLGHGQGAHAPDEYYLIESTEPKVLGFDAAVSSFVDYLYELA